jgi:RimJ/RimL family protein N-acetyltransferase
MKLLPKSEYSLAKPFFTEMDIHLPVTAGLAGDVAINVYTDEQKNPQFGLLVTDGRHYLAGNPNAPGVVEMVRQHYLEVVYPAGLIAGKEAFTLYFPPGDWQSVAEEALASREPISGWRAYYEGVPIFNDWRANLPTGYEFREVTPALLGEPLEGLEDLREEMCSERPSIDAFFAHSFGLAPVHSGRVIGWCLSEYNTGSRCEVGIAVHPPHQRRGLATLLTHAFMEMALAQGIRRIGWHCWQRNIPSSATALRAGLILASQYPVLESFFDPVLNLAVKGNVCFYDDGNFTAALAWYQRAFQAGATFPWAFFHAGCAAAQLGKTDQAVYLLNQAVDHGYHNRSQLETSDYIALLRGSPAFNALLDRL